MTDIALAATLPAALFCFCLWMSRPTAARSVMLGASVGVAILSKFTALARPRFAQLWLRNYESHPNTFLGERSWKGWWWFYPVILAVKTPIGFLILAATGIWFAIKDPPVRKQWRTWTPMSHVNTRVRHIFHIYAMLASVAAFGAVGLWNAGPVWRWLCVALRGGA